MTWELAGQVITVGILGPVLLVGLVIGVLENVFGRIPGQIGAYDHEDGDGPYS